MLHISDYEKNRISNAIVENRFGYIKHNLLKGERNLRCLRCIRIFKEDVVALYKELKLDVGKSALTARRRRRRVKVDGGSSETFSQEIWKKEFRITNSHFCGKHLKKLGSNLNARTTQPTYTYDFVKCVYCGHGLLEETVDWVQCVICNGYVHQKCDSPLEKSYSGQFICQKCTSDVNGNYSTEDIGNNKDSISERNELLRSFGSRCRNFLESITEVIWRRIRGRSWNATQGDKAILLYE